MSKRKRARSVPRMQPRLTEYEPTTAELTQAPQKLKEVRGIFSDFIEDCHGGIVLVTGPTGCGKTAAIKAFVKEFELPMVQWRCQQLLNDFDSKTSYLEDLAQFLQTSVLSRTVKIPGSKAKPASRVILVDGLPDISMPDHSERWRSLLSSVKAMAVRKLVFIVMSDCDARQLDRELGQDLLKGIRILNFSSVTDRQMLKLLKEISSDQQLHLDEDLLREIVMQAKGDLRSALNQLELVKTQDGRSKRFKTNELLTAGKDTHWNTFHALGKFLYNKRLDSDGTSKQFPSERLISDRPPLYFDPATIIRESDCEPLLFVQLLYENFPAFYSDIHDYAEALDSFVVSDYLEALRFSTPSSIEKHSAIDESAAEIVGRAVLDSNLHPSPPMQFTMHKPEHLKQNQLQRAQRNRLAMFKRPLIEWLDVLAFIQPQAFGGEVTLETLALN